MKIGGPEMSMTPMQLDANAVPAPETATSAPNYRPAEQIGRECLSCPNYDGAERMCARHQFAAAPHYVCDDFGVVADNDPKLAGAPPEAALNIPQTVP